MPRFLLAIRSSIALDELRIVDDALEVRQILEQVGDAEQAELGNHGRGIGDVGADDVDRAEAHALDHRDLGAKLRGGEDIDADLPLAALLDELLEHLVALVVHAAEGLVVAHPQADFLRERGTGSANATAANAANTARVKRRIVISSGWTADSSYDNTIS